MITWRQRLERLRNAALYYGYRARWVGNAWDGLNQLRTRHARDRDIRRVGRQVTVLSRGIALELDLLIPQDHSMYRSLSKGPGYEPATSRLVEDLLGPGSTFVDVGANLGYYSVLAAQRVGPTGHVYSFEPNPASRRRLTRNLAVNHSANQVTVFGAAVGETVGRARLFGSPLMDGMDSLVTHTAEFIDVPATTLDQELDSHVIDLVKIDVEGAELSVLSGMREILEKNPHLRMIIEWNPFYGSRSLWEALNRRFHVSVVPAYEGELPPQERTYSEVRYLICNLLCVPKSLSGNLDLSISP